MNRRSMGKWLLLLVSLVSLAFLAPVAAGLDYSRVRIVRLSYVDGNAQMDVRQGQGYERAIANMPVTEGARLWARGDGSLAEVEFEDGTTLRLTPDSSVEFQELGIRSSGEKVTSVDLQEGTAYFDVKGRMGDFRVTFGGQQIAVSRAARFRITGDHGEFRLAVLKGDVDVRSGANQLQVHKNETFTVDLSDPGRYLLAKGVTPDSYDQWNEEREKYHDSYASSAYSSNGSGSYNSYYSGFSPYYSYGLSDLFYYGNYFYAPGWGWMWRPYYTWAGWNPFMDGAWMWYPGFGYMWVSSYPWGWLPYRYGVWSFVPGHGWCWRPGRVWTSWTPVTAVVHAPVGWVAPRPPSAPPPRGGPAIVTVGKGLTPVFPPGVSRPGTSVVRTLDADRESVLPATRSGPKIVTPGAAGTTSTTSSGTTSVLPSNSGPKTVTPPPSPPARTTDVDRGPKGGNHNVTPPSPAPRHDAPTTSRPPSTPRSQFGPSGAPRMGGGMGPSAGGRGAGGFSGGAQVSGGGFSGGGHGGGGGGGGAHAGGGGGPRR